MARTIVIHVDEPMLREVVRARKEGDLIKKEMEHKLLLTELEFKHHLETCKKGPSCPLHLFTAKDFVKYDADGHERFQRVLRQIEVEYAAAGPVSERQPATTDY